MLQQDISSTTRASSKDARKLLRADDLDNASGFFSQVAARLGVTMKITRGGEVPLNPKRDTIVYIRSGSTKLIAKASHDREQIVAFHFEGDLVPISAPKLHAYAMVALKDSEVLSFPADALIDAAANDPTFTREMLQRALVSLYRCREKALGLGRKTAQERLASFFLAMAERTGTVTKGRCDLELPMSRGDIADSLGLTIETISRQFSELRNAGLIETDGRFHVKLLDMAEIAERSGRL